MASPVFVRVQGGAISKSGSNEQQYPVMWCTCSVDMMLCGVQNVCRCEKAGRTVLPAGDACASQPNAQRAMRTRRVASQLAGASAYD